MSKDGGFVLTQVWDHGGVGGMDGHLCVHFGTNHSEQQSYPGNDLRQGGHPQGHVRSATGAWPGKYLTSDIHCLSFMTEVMPS